MKQTKNSFGQGKKMRLLEQEIEERNGKKNLALT